MVLELVDERKREDVTKMDQSDIVRPGGGEGRCAGESCPQTTEQDLRALWTCSLKNEPVGPRLHVNAKNGSVLRQIKMYAKLFMTVRNRLTSKA